MIIGRKYSLGYKMHKVCSRPDADIKSIYSKGDWLRSVAPVLHL